METPAFSLTPLPDGTLPWTRRCFVCGEQNPHGLRLKSRHEAGVVVLRYTTREADLGWKELVHGGLAATLADEVMTWAAMLRARRPCVAAELTVRLRHPIHVGQALRVTGVIESGKPRLMLARGQVLDDDGRVLLEASGKFVPMDPSVAALCADDFVEGPDSIPVAVLFGPTRVPPAAP